MGIQSFAEFCVLHEKQNDAGSSTVWESYLADALTSVANPALQTKKSKKSKSEFERKILDLAIRHVWSERRRKEYPKLFKKIIREALAQHPKVKQELDANPDWLSVARAVWRYDRGTKQYVSRNTKSSVSKETQQVLLRGLTTANAAWRDYKQTPSIMDDVEKRAQQNRKQYPKSPVQRGKFSQPDISDKTHQSYAPDAFAIAKQLVRPNMKGIVFYRVAEKPDISDDYRHYGGSDSTSKADIISTPEGFRFSLKNAGTGSVLVTGQVSDAIATFNLAKHRYDMEPIKISEPALKTLKKELTEKLVPITWSLTPQEFQSLSTLVDVRHATGKPSDGRPGLLQAAELALSPSPSSKFDTQTQGKLQKLVKDSANIKTLFTNLLMADTSMGDRGKVLSTLFNADERFRELFVFESATGAGKFGGQNAPVNKMGPEGSANYILKFDPAAPDNPNNNKIIFIGNTKSPAIRKLSTKVKFKLRWRHFNDAPDGSATIALQLPISKEETIRTAKTIHEISMQHEYEQFMIREGIWDTVQRTARITADMFGQWWAAFKRWWSQFISQYIQRILQIAAQGYSALMAFFGMHVDSVEVVESSDIWDAL